MSSKIVQVKSHVVDPDFPTLKLANKHLEYVKSLNSDQVLLKFITPSKEYIAMCDEFGLDYNIALSRSKLHWHEKDWNTDIGELSCYSSVKRKRKTSV